MSLELFPRTEMEILLGPIRWQVLESADEIRACALHAYNTCVTTHFHRRALLEPDRENPLRQMYRFNSHRDYAEKLGYEHAQVLVLGRIGEATCARLHLSIAAKRYLHLHEIELANPSVPAKRPLGPDQRFEGLGHGIFAEVLRRVRAHAGARALERVIAYAIDEARLDLFVRKGFEIDTDDARILEHARACGSQFPIRIAPL